MKIAIPVNEDKKTVCKSFGRTLLFALVDSTSGDVEFLENKAAANQGGAGIEAAQTLLDHGVEAVLVPQCGVNAARVFAAGKVNIFRTEGDSIKDNVAAFNDGKLEILDEIHAGFHGSNQGCGKGCNKGNKEG